MRLRSYLKELEIINNDFNLKTSPRNSNPPTFQLMDIKNLKFKLDSLYELHLFDNQIENLKKQSFYNQTLDKIVISSSENALLEKEIFNISNSISLLNSLLKNIIPKESNDLISIKIPTPHNFTDIEKITNKLNLIFSQTLLNDKINGSIKIANFDSGSFWIDFLVGTGEVVTVVASICWSSAVAFKKLQEGLLLQQQVKALKISNDAFKEIVDKHKENYNEIVESEAKFIQNEHFKDTDNEQLGRIKLAINELADLFSKGAEIYPSIEAANQIKEQFPDYKKLETIESKIKKLKDKN